MSTTFPVPRFPTNCNPTVIPGTIFLRPWSRSRGQTCQLTTTVTSHELDWRRKAEILKHKQKGNSMTQAQRYARVATNTLVRRNQTFATQNKNSIPNYTNPNTHNLQVINGNQLELPNCVPRITYTYGADVPGPVLALTPVPNVPLTRYNPERRQYRGGGEKWPQWAWYPGANGFPIGASGRNR
jgi:hypothetical protein